MTSDTASRIAYLTRVLKGPTLRDSAERLAERARADSWTHQEYLAACLEAEAATRARPRRGQPDPGRRDPARSRFLASYPARHNQSGCHRCADREGGVAVWLAGEGRAVRAVMAGPPGERSGSRC